MSASPTQLLNRACVITVGTKQISRIGLQKGLDVWFEVRRSLKAREPNTADVRFYNLSDDTRKAIESSSNALLSPTGVVLDAEKLADGLIAGNAAAIDALAAATPVIPVEIQAGYVGALSTIFLGEMRSAQTTTSGPDTVTEMTTGDGDEALIQSRTNASFGPGTSPYFVVLRLLKDMNLGNGNLATVAKVLTASQMYGKGVVLKGNSFEILCDLVRSVGLEVSVQGGVAQFVKLGQPLGGEAYSLSSNSGLIGSPSVDTKGILSFRMLMAPGIAPGKPIVMNAKYVQGLYRITSVTTTGDTNGDDWSHSCDAKRIGLAP